jgi:hypothetical protein
MVTLDADIHALFEHLGIVGGVDVGRALVGGFRISWRTGNHIGNRSDQNSEAPHEASCLIP